MPGKARTQAACHKASLADLHERIGKGAAQYGTSLHSGGHRYDARKPSPLRDLEVTEYVRPAIGPEFNRAHDHHASHSPERRAELEGEWK
jgi:hypothetical protein